MSRPARKRLPRLLAFFVVSTLGLTILLYSVYGQRQQSFLEPGSPSPVTYVAPVDIEVIDRVATERQRQSARNQIDTIYTANSRLQQIVLASIAAAGLPRDVEEMLLEAYSQPRGVNAEELDELIERAASLAGEEREQEIRITLSNALLPTSTPNQELTEAARNAAANATPPVMQRLAAGQAILREGETVTQEQLQVLQSVGLYSPRFAQFSHAFWIALGCLALAALLSLPLLFIERRMAGRLTISQLGFLVGLTLLVLVLQRLTLVASPAFLFVLLVPLLVSVLLSDTLGVVWSIWLGLAVALLVPTAPLFTLIAVVAGGTAASLLATSLKSRTSLLLAGASGGAVSALALAVMALALGGYTPLATFISGLLLVAAGLIAGVIALGLLPLAESTFGFITEFRLVELSSPTSPLLQRLLLDAPGTYQHSLVISNLVEQAVKNIGGDYLLARVGSLYHDVGKLKRPSFFTENQFSEENPHDKISPHLSYLIIVAHVRDGLELLEDYRIPTALQPFVAEHHGTTVLTYFYKRALESQESVDELNFRYPGPKPRSKETAVLMLADAVESASRSLSDPSQGSIRALIDRLVEQRLQDGQLSESQLNFNDLEVIKNTFERMLTAILHRRVNYPTAEEIRGAKERGSTERGGGSGRNEPVPARG